MAESVPTGSSQNLLILNHLVHCAKAPFRCFLVLTGFIMFPSFNALALGLDMEIDEVLGLAHRAGFDGVDLPLRDLLDARTDLVELRQRMDDMGLRAGAFPFPVSWRQDETTYREGLRRLPVFAAAAAQLGLCRTGTWVLPATKNDLKATADWHRDRLGTMARVLADQGISIGIEAIGPRSARAGLGQPFVTRLADIEARLGPLWRDHTNLGLLVDAFHLFAADEPIQVALKWGVGRVVWCHVADLPADATGDRDAIQDDDRGLPGERGRIDCASLLAELEQAGYGGPVTIETRSVSRALRHLGPEGITSAAAAALRRIWPSRLTR